MKNTPETVAADLSKWQAGNIMSDEVMSDYNSMTTAQIQAFLKSKNSCNNTNIGLAKTYSSYSYHIKDGHFVCMADEDFNGQSAADIIHEAARDYKINPKVIIVLLQKEQGLVTDTWPNSVQYRSATGYGCPDTAPCDAQYYGLRNQIRQAASLFRSVLDGGWSNYAVGYHNIQYSPNSSCGSSRVYVQNRATSALYRYTPYQPNQASLNAGYGSGDSCSSYGNRNFYQYYVDWFGDTRSKSTSQRTYTIHSLDDVSQSVPEGTYTFGSSHNPGFVADVAGGSKNSGAKVQLYWNNGTGAQQWRLTYNSDRTYTFTNVGSGKVLDISGANMVNGTQLQQYDSNNTCAQRWLFIPNGDHYWIASSCDPNYVIDLSNGNVSNGARMQIWNKADNKNQFWEMKTTIGAVVKKPAQVISDGAYTFYSNVGNDQVLEIGGGSTAAGKAAQTWSSNNTKAQQWTFTYNPSDGTYFITNVNSGQKLDLDGGRVSNKNKIQQWTHNGCLAQKWFVVKDGDSYRLYSGVNINYAVDVDGARNSNGTTVQLYQANGSNAQSWKLVETANNGELRSGNYHLETKLKSNMYADIDNGSTANLAQAQIYEKDGTPVQNWYVSKESDGTYRFKNLKSGKYLDVDAAIAENGRKVQIYDGNSSCAQRWFVTNENGSYKIASSCNKDYVLDVAGAATSNGTKIQLYASNDTAAQRWNFISY